MLTEQQQAGASRRPNILIVEDADATRRRLAATLQNYGYTVIEAGNGRDALEALSRDPIDAILLDLLMPTMNGWQFRENQLRHPHLARIPTVVVTVKPLMPHERYALRADHVVQKPFADEDVIGALERVRRPSFLSPTPPPYHTPDGVVLFWSKRGHIACAGHAPDATSLEWRTESWTPIPAHAGKGRITYQCQYCAGHDGPIDRSRPGPSKGRPRTDRRSAVTREATPTRWISEGPRHGRLAPPAWQLNALPFVLGVLIRGGVYAGLQRLHLPAQRPQLPQRRRGLGSARRRFSVHTMW
jgi:CheY-like chemotaxis protein